MKSLAVYLNFDKITEEVFLFYRSIFGGEFISFNRFRENPDTAELSETLKNCILHVSLEIAPGYFLMGSDAPSEFGFNPFPGQNTYIMLDLESEAETDRLFESLSKGGQVEMAPQKTFWNAYFASFSDQFGIKWMLSYSYQMS